MACQVLLEFGIKDGCHDKLKQTFKEIVADTRDFEGCITLHMIRDRANPTRIIIVELWETQEHYEAYLKWRTERGDMDILGPMMEDPSWRFFDFWGV
ncbi:MAG: putative quinol monooxygenase [Gammaproteobacteria bacterium]